MEGQGGFLPALSFSHMHMEGQRAPRTEIYIQKGIYGNGNPSFIDYSDPD